MSGPSSPGEASWLRVPVIGADEDAARAFIQAVVGGDRPMAFARATCQHYPVELRTMTAEPAEAPAEWVARATDGDAVALLAHFLDAASLSELGRRYQRLHDTCRVPLGAFLFREPDEHAFKISCWDCGQKLLVDDRDVGKRGSCVQCGRAFRISTPSEYLRRALALADAVPILLVARGDTALCQGALANLLARAAPHLGAPYAADGAGFLHQATVPIEVDRGGLRIGPE